MEVIETPFHFAQNLNLIRTAGALIDITELDELKRNLNRHQNAQLEILGTLDTAFAVFDDKFHLSFYNPAFAGLWKLENLWLEQQPTYAMFLDVLREKRLLPEVPDFIAFKNEEQKAFSSIIEPKKIFCICRTEGHFAASAPPTRSEDWFLPLRTFRTIWQRPAPTTLCYLCRKTLWTICLTPS